jgi:hypothetical protein
LVLETDGESELTRKIQKEVIKRNEDPDWREWVMTFEDKLMINGEEKKAEGKAEGKTEEQVSEIRQKVTTPKDQNGVSPE